MVSIGNGVSDVSNLVPSFFLMLSVVLLSNSVIVKCSMHAIIGLGLCASPTRTTSDTCAA
jgi:hypothetical protein